jgi:hypothetical protein
VAHAVIDGKGPLMLGGALVPGLIAKAEVELLRRILHAHGGDGNIAITRAEAEVLFRINERTAQGHNDPSWNDLFVKAIANTGAKRVAVLPDLPTAREQGLDFEVNTWQGLFLPKGTPDPIVRRLNSALGSVLDLPSVRERFDALGEQIAAPERRSPEYFAKFVASEIERWRAPIKASGVSVD